MKKRCSSLLPPPRHWIRYVDDTFVIQREDQKQIFLDHINKTDPVIKLTIEGNQENRDIPFLDTLVKPETNNSLSITIYRKPMHTNQYLQLDSYHNCTAEYSVVSTLTHRAKVVCTGPEVLTKELQHLRRALTKCKYPKWALDKVAKRILNTVGKTAATRGNPQKKRPATLAATLQGGILTRINAVKVT